MSRAIETGLLLFRCFFFYLTRFWFYDLHSIIITDLLNFATYLEHFGQTQFLKRVTIKARNR